jgi:GMP synthase (glutamine-hydrolysing)
VVIVYRYLDLSTRDPSRFIEGAISFIKKYVGAEDKVESAVSGGVDSTVTTKLFHLAGVKIYADHIDTGFMRRFKGREEPSIVAKTFEDMENFSLVDEKEFFYSRVFGIEDAEEKRRAFRAAYSEVFDRLLKKRGCNVITQGTIYPDIVETNGGIKSQHNVQIEFEVEKIVEPIAALYKHEVRMVAKALRLKEDVYLRMPFPGPGLSIRVPGAITRDRLEVEKAANDIVEQRIASYMEKRYGKPVIFDETGEQIPFQAFAATFKKDTMEVPLNIAIKAEKIIKKHFADKWEMKLLSTKVTGVRNGKRVYAHPLCLDLDLDLAEVDFKAFKAIGSEIPLQTGLSRVLLKLVSSKGEGYPIAIRVIKSRDAMSASVMDIDLSYLKKTGEEISRIAGVGDVYYDISDKPPATIEYE